MPDAFVRLSEASKAQGPSKTSLDVSGTTLVNSAAVSDAPVEDPYVLLLQRAMLARLMTMGFSKAEAREALESAGWVEEDATFALLKSLQPAETSTPSTPNEEETLAERGEEAMALEAILEEDFKIVEENKLWRVKVTLEEDANGVLWEPCELEIHFPPDNLYPAEAALFVVCHDKLPLELRRSINATIAAQAYAYVGEAAVYAMVVWLQENMPTILAERGIVDAEPERVQVDDVDDKADAFVLTGRGAHIKRTYERLEAQQAKEEAAEEERLRRIKYFRAMMAEEKARAEREVAQPEEQSDRAASSDALASEEPCEDFSLEAKLTRWEREHARRLEEANARAAKVKKKIVPNASKLKQTPASEETDGKTGKSGKAKGGWLANQVKKAGLDKQAAPEEEIQEDELATACLLYTSPSPRD